MKVYLSDEPTNIFSYEEYEVDNLLEFLQSKYDSFPATARIYHNSVAISNDVTPKTEEDIEKLKSLTGTFYVLVYPGDPVTIIVAVVAIAATAAAAFLLKPKIPQAVSTDRQADVGSSNNQLGSRQNQARLNGRVPDIFGQVRSIPDLITLPYTFFDTAGTEYELSYMCVGRGTYDISDVREGVTAYNANMGGYEFYNPGSSAISGTPFLSGGTPIIYNVKNYNRLAAVNGDTVPLPTTGSVAATSNCFINNQKLVNTTTGAQSTTGKLYIGWDNFLFANANTVFSIGDTVTLSSTSHSAINGTYTVVSLQSSQSFRVGAQNKPTTVIELAPSGSLPAVNMGVFQYSTSPSLYNYLGSASANITMTKSSASILGPFAIDDVTTTELLVNLIAPSGIYGGSTVQIQVDVTPLPSGSVVSTVISLSPKTDFNGFKGYTQIITLPGKCTVSFKRLTAKLTQDTDEIKIRDVYYGKALTGSYSDVTTVLVMSKQTQTPTSADERKFNCLAYRKIPKRVSGSTFSGTLYATNSADDIICAICLDDKIGRRSVSELDVDSIYNTVAAVKAAFGPAGVAECGQFNYTFDRSGLSFEETMASIAAAIHCVAYRQGSVIKLNFESSNPTATLLLNHRNIIPESSQRAISFGIINDYDGVKCKYIDPTNDQETIMYVPNTSIINPKDIEFIGIRNKKQAYYLAWRAWNKLKYQYLALKVQALQESDLIVINDKVLAADLTRNDVYDGEVISQSGLTIYLNIEVTVTNGDSIFFQYADGTIGSRTIVSQPAPNAVTLNSAPAVSLVTDIDKYARTPFIIQRASSNVNTEFIVTDKSPSDRFTNELNLINYDANYYANDTTDPATI